MKYFLIKFVSYRENIISETFMLIAEDHLYALYVKQNRLSPAPLVLHL